jgi:ubiquinone/menaquinone biosynthesis C-methylase UbiE
MDIRKQNEIKFHDQRYIDGKDKRAGFEKFYKVTIDAQNHFKNLIIQNLSKKKINHILDYGCGSDSYGYLGTNSFGKPEKIYKFYKSLNGIFYGIDISPEAIKSAKKNAKKNKFTIHYYVGDAENTKFKKNQFDAVIGRGILHHLNLEKAVKELSRIVKNEGSCIFFEPLDHNPIVKIGRLLTPNARTPDEKPIKKNDYKIFYNYFTTVNLHKFGFFTLFAFLFFKTPLFDSILKILHRFERFVFKLIPKLSDFSWIVLIELKNSKTN